MKARNRWKTIVAFIMILSLISGFVPGNIAFAEGENATASNADTINILENNGAMIPVKMYVNGTFREDRRIPAGVIADNIEKQEGDLSFQGAYMVDESGQEDEIAYVGNYHNDEDGTDTTFYAYSKDSSTGTLLRANQYIKLEYSSTYRISYHVEDESGAECPAGGSFTVAPDTMNYGVNPNVQFQTTAGVVDGKCYQLVSIRAEGEDGSVKQLNVDESGYCSVGATRNTTVIATVKLAEKFRLYVDEQKNGHVCWAGHGDEKNSNPSDPYSVDPKKFCSYRASDGANVTAAPGETIYFVMYSQKNYDGSLTKNPEIYKFKQLIINGIYVEAICDGNIHHTDLGNGMTAYFRYLGKDEKDSQLSSNASAKRSKFECWVTNVSTDIHVKFKCYESYSREVLSLAKADGIDNVCASTFDRKTGGGSLIFGGALMPSWGHYDYYNDLYTPKSNVGDDLSNVYYTNSAPYAQSFFGEWSLDWTYSERAHVEMQSDVFDEVPQKGANWGDEVTKWGARYVYFKTKAGYNPKTTQAYITGYGQNGEDIVPVSDMGHTSNLVNKSTTAAFFNNNLNDALDKAKSKGYEWYVWYEGCGIEMRNLYLSCDPYVYRAEYDLAGGTMAGSIEYTADGTYTIQNGRNKIAMPNQTPQKKGYVFAGWKLESINEGASSKDTIYNAGAIFTIDSSNYQFGLDTEKQVYTVHGTTYTEYAPKDNGDHRFRFVAQWQEKAAVPDKAEYSVKIYTEVPEGTQGAVLADDRWYTVTEEYAMGNVGETIISIHETPEGYVLDKKHSVTALQNFMQDGNTKDEMIYRFNLAEWGIEKTATPTGAETKEDAAAVHISDKLQYTLNITNKEEVKVVLPAGTVVQDKVNGNLAPTNLPDLNQNWTYECQDGVITYTLQEPVTLKPGKTISLNYATKVTSHGLMGEKATLQAYWKTYESGEVYHVTTADLTLTMKAEGKYADYTKAFNVNITLKDANGNVPNDKKITCVGGKVKVTSGNDKPKDEVITLTKNGSATLKLKHGQTMTLKDIPYGYQYTIAQEDAKGYTTTYQGVLSGTIGAGEYYPGTDVPIVTDVWPNAEDFADEYEQKTLSPSGIFQYDGEYYVVCREAKISRWHVENEALKDSLLSSYNIEKLTGTIVEVEDDANQVHPVKRGDIIKYKGEYYVFNDGGEWSGNPQNNARYYKLSGGIRVDISNTYEGATPAGVSNGGENVPTVIAIASALAGIGAVGYIAHRRKRRSNA